jgi:hydroxymethylglutaryl-CoA lyase
MRDAPDVHVCEISPRDGLRSLDNFVPTETKCALIDAIVAASARQIDVGSSVLGWSFRNSATST